MKRTIITTLVFVPAILVTWCVFAPRISWDGSVAGRIEVRVVDEQTLAPIAGATVELRHPRRDEASPTFDPEFCDKLLAEAATDSSGTARIIAGFGAGGTTGIFGRSGEVVYANKWLQVSADGYETARMPLSRYTGETRSVRRDQTTALTIKLAPEEVKPRSHQDTKD